MVQTKRARNVMQHSSAKELSAAFFPYGCTLQ